MGETAGTLFQEHTVSGGSGAVVHSVLAQLFLAFFVTRNDES